MSLARGSKRWPLHPNPHAYETLETYVRRLAECYGARYETFCLQALGMPLAESQARRFETPAREVIERLSEGTGVAPEQFEQMTIGHLWARLSAEIDTIRMTPEGRAELERMSGRWLSQNS